MAASVEQRAIQLLQTLHGRFVLAAWSGGHTEAFLFIRKDPDTWRLNPSRGRTLKQNEDRDSSRRTLTSQTLPIPRRRKMGN